MRRKNKENLVQKYFVITEKIPYFATEFEHGIMYLNKELKAEIFAKNNVSHNATDTGSPESQVALFTYRINHITEHLKVNPKDKASQQGLLKLVGKRRRLLDYLKREHLERYRDLIAKLGIRR